MVGINCRMIFNFFFFKFSAKKDVLSNVIIDKSYKLERPFMKIL